MLGRLSGTYHLMTSLLYVSGLRLLECVSLRVKELDLSDRRVTDRDGKGERDRRTVLPDRLVHREGQVDDNEGGAPAPEAEDVRARGGTCVAEVIGRAGSGRRRVSAVPTRRSQFPIQTCGGRRARPAGRGLKGVGVVAAA